MLELENQEQPTTGLSVLTPFQHQEAELTKLAQDYKNLVVTEQNLKEAEEARMKLWRIRVKEIAKTLKQNLEKIKSFKTEQEEKAEKLCNIIQPVEEDLEKRIQIVKAAKEKREKEEKEKEAKRVLGHRTKVAELNKLTLKVNVMEMEELSLIDISWADSYDAQEFMPEFTQALTAINLAINSRKELLVLRKAEADRKAKEEAEKAGAKKYDDDFKVLTEMLTSVNIEEDLTKVEILLEIGTNSQPSAYGPHAAQAQGVLAALKMLAETRREFLIKRAQERVTFSAKKEVVQEESIKEEPLPTTKEKWVMMETEQVELPENDNPTFNRGTYGTYGTYGIVGSKQQPKEEPPTTQPEIPAGMSTDNTEYNYFSINEYRIALSKNVSEKAAKSILNYCTHILQK